MKTESNENTRTCIHRHRNLDSITFRLICFFLTLHFNRLIPFTKNSFLFYLAYNEVTSHVAANFDDRHFLVAGKTLAGDLVKKSDRKK